MLTQDIQTITKETQKLILKTLCEFPTCTTEELVQLLQKRDKKILAEEVIQVLHTISPTKNWHRATQEEIQKEILDYVWILEAQILFTLPTKQKETTIAEFNQTRLQNKQSKISKDLVRHIQTLLMVDAKNLSKFRKFQKELVFNSDTDPNTQGTWLVRLILGDVSIEKVSSVQELATLISEELKEKYPTIAEKVGKTLNRISDRFVEKYFLKTLSESQLKELISKYQSVLKSYRSSDSRENVSQSELQSQSKVIQNIYNELNQVKIVVSESCEGSFLTKLFVGKLKNKEAILKKVDDVINFLNQLEDSNEKTNRANNEKVLLMQKIQSDYESIAIIKNQLENDLFNLNEKVRDLSEKSSSLDNELHNARESLEKAHEKIASLQQKADTMPELESRVNVLKEDLTVAKDISLRLYQRLIRIKSDLLRTNDKGEKVKTTKQNGVHVDSSLNNNHQDSLTSAELVS